MRVSARPGFPVFFFFFDLRHCAGNEHVRRKEFAAAYELYTQALEYHELPTILGNRCARHRTCCRLTRLPCKSALTLVHLERFADAIDDCTRALQLDPDYPKAYARLGCAASWRCFPRSTPRAERHTRASGTFARRATRMPRYLSLRTILADV